MSSVIDVAFAAPGVSGVPDGRFGHGMGRVAFWSARCKVHALMRYWVSHVGIVLIFMFGLRLVHPFP